MSKALVPIAHYQTTFKQDLARMTTFYIAGCDPVSPERVHTLKVCGISMEHRFYLEYCLNRRDMENIPEKIYFNLRLFMTRQDLNQKRVCLLYAEEGDWVAVYVDGTCVEQAHDLTQISEGGASDYAILKLAEKYGFTSNDILTVYEENIKNLVWEVNVYGTFPPTLDDLFG